jgi:superfamily II DNA or RNA helicase
MARHFTFTADATGAVLRCEERKLLKQRVVRFDEWDHPAVPFLRRLHSEGRALMHADGLFLPTDSLLMISEGMAQALNLPPLATMTLTLSLKGRIETPDGQLQAAWHDRNYRQVRPDRQGLFVILGKDVTRLSPPLFRLVDAIDQYNATVGQSGDARIPHWMPVQNALRGAIGEDVKVERLISNFTIHQAGAFALDVREGINGPSFDPVLMGYDSKPNIFDLIDAPENDGASETLAQDTAPNNPAAGGLSHEQLLSYDHQRAFAHSFSSHNNTRASYVVAPNTYVVIAPELRRALDVVRRISASSPDERRRFVKNPRSFLVEELADVGDEAGCLFVETQSYSTRVLGLGLWEKPELPWGMRKGTGWLPERLTLKIDDKTVHITPEELPTLDTQVKESESNFRPTVDWKEISYPTRSVRSALSPLGFTGIDQETSDGITEDHAGTPDQQDAHILKIKTNFDDVEHSESTRRHARVNVQFPFAEFAETTPKPHQEAGFRWLAESWASGRPGVLLADDMGLGKTLQALAFLVWIKPLLRDRGPFLIVAPTALLRNWQAEAEKHLRPGALGTCTEVFGSAIGALRRPRGDDWTPEDALDVERLKRADWILTTYETLSNYHRAFARIRYPVAIFDEMQKVKSPDTINTHAAKAMNIDFVLGLTGTPIENRIEDLWCLMDRIHPGLMGSLKEFSASYGTEDPEALRNLKDKLSTGSEVAPPVLLRRMKEDHLPGLPTRVVRDYPTVMPAKQAGAYEAIIASAGAARGKKGEMLKIVHALRGISLHPFTRSEINPFDASERNAWFAASARVAKTLEILLEVKSQREKALVFIEDRQVQRLFSAAITQELRLPSEPSIINGGTSGDKRQQIVDRFQSSQPGFDLLVLSPKAAGVGLTITSANHVIHLSRWWNPAVEDQCNDRVYRIGQEKPVTIHIPQAVHPAYADASFDLKLDQLLAAKRALSKDMLVPPVSEGDAESLFRATVKGI